MINYFMNYGVKGSYNQRRYPVSPAGFAPWAFFRSINVPIRFSWTYETVTFNHGVEGLSPSALSNRIRHYLNFGAFDASPVWALCWQNTCRTAFSGHIEERRGLCGGFRPGRVPHGRFQSSPWPAPAANTACPHTGPRYFAFLPCE